MKFKIKKLQVARHTVQILFVLLMLAVPAVARYTNYLSARELDKNLDKWDGELQGEALAIMDATFRALPGGEKQLDDLTRRNRTQVLSYAQALRGGPWSIKLGPLSMTDPLGVAESVAGSKRVTKVLMISLIVPVIVTLLFGRVFCSWFCPMNLFLECCDKLRGMLRFLELRPRDFRFSYWNKYILLVVGLIMTAIISVPILGYIYPPAIIGREAHDFIFGVFDRAEIGRFGMWFGGLTWMSVVLLAVAVFEVAVSRRWWCRYMCPGGALYAILGWVRPVRVKLSVPKCTRCTECIDVCPVGLNPMEGELGRECDNCGECISYCPDDALNYGVGLKYVLQSSSDSNAGKSGASNNE